MTAVLLGEDQGGEGVRGLVVTSAPSVSAFAEIPYGSHTAQVLLVSACTSYGDLPFSLVSSAGALPKGGTGLAGSAAPNSQSSHSEDAGRDLPSLASTGLMTWGRLSALRMKLEEALSKRCVTPRTA